LIQFSSADKKVTACSAVESAWRIRGQFLFTGSYAENLSLGGLRTGLWILRLFSTNLIFVLI
jgi:hypothetical protein